VAQVVVEYKKKFTDVFVGFPRNLNDLRVLHKSTLYRKVENHSLFAYDPRFYQYWFLPYLLDDKGYPLMTWIMTPFKEEDHHTVLKLLYNMRHKREHSIVENAFGILKKTFREFFTKFELHVSFVPNVFIICCLLHNILCFQIETNVKRLMWIIDVEL
jgi:hypothetical protein